MKKLLWIIVLILVILGIWYGTQGTDETAVDVPTDGAEMMSYTATITNLSDTQPLSPGVYVLHTHDASINFEGSVAPESLEALAEVGNPAAFAEFLAGVDGVMEVITIDAPVLPGEEASFTFDVAEGTDMHLSGIQMLVATNDGYALVDSLELMGEAVTVAAVNHDAGTEENTEPGSGFDGGQPDPSRGEENLDNGVATDPHAPVAVHDQVTETVLELSVAVN